MHYFKHYPVGIFLLQKPKSAPPKSKSFTLPKAHPIRGFLMSAPLLHHFDMKVHCTNIGNYKGERTRLHSSHYPLQPALSFRACRGISYATIKNIQNRLQNLPSKNPREILSLSPLQQCRFSISLCIIHLLSHLPYPPKTKEVAPKDNLHL